MAIRLINIGFGNIVSASRIIAIGSPESAPIKRIIQEQAKAAGLTVTDYLCYSGLGKEIVRVDGLEQVLTELKAQGRNLNQLTTLANMGKVTVVYGDRFAESYQQISEQLRQLLREVT